MLVFYGPFLIWTVNKHFVSSLLESPIWIGLKTRGWNAYCDSAEACFGTVIDAATGQPVPTQHMGMLTFDIRRAEPPDSNCLVLWPEGNITNEACDYFAQYTVRDKLCEVFCESEFFSVSI